MDPTLIVQDWTPTANLRRRRVYDGDRLRFEIVQAWVRVVGYGHGSIETEHEWREIPIETD